MDYQLYTFDFARHVNQAPAAEVLIVENDGTEKYKWLSLAEIRQTVEQFGPHAGLLKAGKAYGVYPAELVQAWKDAGRKPWLRPLDPVRCSLGYYTHHDYPTHVTDAEFDYWSSLVGIECSVVWMENDDVDELKARYDLGDNDILAWEPQRPEGNGWFVGSIHETEDGPVCVWLRHKEEV